MQEKKVKLELAKSCAYLVCAIICMIMAEVILWVQHDPDGVITMIELELAFATLAIMKFKDTSAIYMAEAQDEDD